MEAPVLATADLILRIVIACLLGASIGIEREFRDQSAGFRTHMLVSLGAALFTIAGAYGFSEFSETGHLRYDPTRVAAQVVTGIGFLGAGAIIREGFTVRGLTTAAAMWVTAAIGTAVGLGNYVAAVVSTVIALVALFGLRSIKKRYLARARRDEAELRVGLASATAFDEALAVLQTVGVEIVDARLATESGGRFAYIEIVVPKRSSRASVLAKLANVGDAASAEFTD